MIKHYTLTLTAKGPVHIGSGQEIKKFEYVYDRDTRKVYVIDSYKLFKALDAKQMDRFEDHMTTNRNLTEFFEAVGIRSEQYSKLSGYSYSAADPKNNNIKAFIKDIYGRPYIPGSSLKGALRTAILYIMIKDNKDIAEKSRKAVADIIGEIKRDRENASKRVRKDLTRISADLEASLINTLGNDIKKPTNAVNSILRGLRISDSDPLPVDVLCLASKLDVGKRDEKSPNLLRECIAPETKITFDMDIDDAYFPYDADHILDCLDEYYDLQEWQMSQFDTHPTIKAKAGEHYTVIGGGAGYVSKTFTHQLMTDEDDMDLETVSQILHAQFYKHRHNNDVRNGVSPHMRKMTRLGGRYYDFGICRVDIKART